jgi:polysaccharide chain length determinant protein (PEP-CTERM system associated)
MLSWICVLWKRKLLISSVFVALGVLASAIVWWLPPVYRAEVLVLVESQRIPERYVSSTVGADLNDRLTTLKQQIMSYSSLLKIINKYDLYKDERTRMVEEEIVDLMRRHIDVTLEQGWRKDQAGAFRIKYEAGQAAIAAQIANELAQLFVDQNLLSREVHAQGTSDFLKTQVEEAKKRLEGQEAILSEYKRKHNGELPQQENALISSLSRLQVQLQSVQDAISREQQNKILRDSELSAAESSETTLKRLSDQLDESAKDGSARGADPEVAQMEKLLAALRTKYTDAHPDVIKARETLAALKRKRGDEAGTAEASRAPTDAGQVAMTGTMVRERERMEQIKTQQAIIAKRLEDLEAEKTRILREMNTLQARVSQLPIREQQIASIARDYETSKANYQSLLDKKLAAEMAAEMEINQKSESFRVLDAARIPEKPVKPDRWIWALAGWLAALALAVGTGLAVEFNKNVVLGEWELPADVPVLGRVPRIVLNTAGAAPALGGHDRGRLAAMQMK